MPLLFQLFPLSIQPLQLLSLPLCPAEPDQQFVYNEDDKTGYIDREPFIDCSENPPALWALLEFWTALAETTEGGNVPFFAVSFASLPLPAHQVFIRALIDGSGFRNLKADRTAQFSFQLQYLSIHEPFEVSNLFSTSS